MFFLRGKARPALNHEIRIKAKLMDQELKEQQEFYDDIWRKGLYEGTENRGNMQINLQFLQETNLLKASEKILEIGCGTGGLVNDLSKKGFDIIGIDISQEAIAFGIKKFKDIKLSVQAAEQLPYPDGSFNVVLSFDLFEHIARVDRHVSEVYRILVDDGYYLLQTPNKYSSAFYSTYVCKSFKWRRAHPSLHSPGQLKRRLKKHGFKKIDFVKMNTINEFTMAKFKQLGLIGRLCSHVNFTKLPLCMQTNLYVIAQK
jgi:ubiquinone/menaquinone biosynthesis C-methylase UbiE